ncbi:PE-PGRS family protein, partial [Trypanosoma conorhini]
MPLSKKGAFVMRGDSPEPFRRKSGKWFIGSLSVFARRGSAKASTRESTEANPHSQPPPSRDSARAEAGDADKTQKQLVQEEAEKRTQNASELITASSPQGTDDDGKGNINRSMPPEGASPLQEELYAEIDIDDNEPSQQDLPSGAMNPGSDPKPLINTRTLNPAASDSSGENGSATTPALEKSGVYDMMDSTDLTKYTSSTYDIGAERDSTEDIKSMYGMGVDQGPAATASSTYGMEGPWRNSIYDVGNFALSQHEEQPVTLHSEINSSAIDQRVPEPNQHLTRVPASAVPKSIYCKIATDFRDAKSETKKGLETASKPKEDEAVKKDSKPPTTARPTELNDNVHSLVVVSDTAASAVTEKETEKKVSVKDTDGKVVEYEADELLRASKATVENSALLQVLRQQVEAGHHCAVILANGKQQGPVSLSVAQALLKSVMAALKKNEEEKGIKYEVQLTAAAMPSV